jgi:hypothetical protein
LPFDHRVVPERYFTPEEANDALATVRPLAEELVAHRRKHREAQEARAELGRRIAGNGGDLDVRRLAALEDDVKREAAELARCVARLQELGVLVKDLDRGLVDFPALRGTEEVLLCWQVGEEGVAHWHGLEEGFAGRRPLPL